MISYELARELKEAGFPQGGRGAWALPPDALVGRSKDRVYVPDLSELIEACGADFGSLAQNGSFKRYTPHQTRWVAWRSGPDHGVSGDTPEEAVANLWLALQKKS